MWLTAKNDEVERLASEEGYRPWDSRRVKVKEDFFDPKIRPGDWVKVEDHVLRKPVIRAEVIKYKPGFQKTVLIHAKITNADLDRGCAAQKENRKFISLLSGGLPGIEAGHLIADRLGGQSGRHDNYNFIPQYWRSNMAQIMLEDEVYNHVEKHGTAEVRARVLYHDTDPGYPYAVVFNVKGKGFYTGGSISFYISNPKSETDILQSYNGRKFDKEFEQFKKKWQERGSSVKKVKVEE